MGSTPQVRGDWDAALKRKRAARRAGDDAGFAAAELDLDRIFAQSQQGLPRRAKSA